MQDSKMTKKYIRIFVNNSNLATMRKHLNYKSIDKMRNLLIELPYNKVTWQIKSRNIHLAIADMLPKKYLIYYLDIILAIRFLIGHQVFAQYMAYALV